MVAPLVGAAIATGASQIVGGFLGGKGASRAARAQAQSQAQALQYQRSRDAIADQRYKQSWDDYNKRYATWEEMTRAQLGMGAPSGGGGGAAAGPQTLGDLAAVQASINGAGVQNAPADAAPAGGSLADMATKSDWTDWRRYGAGVQ